jgi:hypothetical protein
MGWKEKLAEMKANPRKDIKEMMDKHQTAHNKDVGFYGKNGGSVFVRDGGCVDLFAKEGCGIRIDPDTDSVSIYATKINLHGSTIDMYTNTQGLKWNKFPINLTFVLLGQAGPFPCVTQPGTLMPYNTGFQDVSMFVAKATGTLMGGGG